MDLIREEWVDIATHDGQTILSERLADAALSVAGIAKRTDEVEAKYETSKPAKLGDLVDGYLQMSQDPGIKRVARISAIQSALGERLHVNADNSRWEKFAKFADGRQQNHGEELGKFLNWMTAQKGYDPQFWPPSKMEEMWPQAFIVSSTPVRMEGKSSGYYG
jgi:hypothetical protein